MWIAAKNCVWAAIFFLLSLTRNYSTNKISVDFAEMCCNLFLLSISENIWNRKIDFLLNAFQVTQQHWSEEWKTNPTTQQAWQWQSAVVFFYRRICIQYIWQRFTTFVSSEQCATNCSWCFFCSCTVSMMQSSMKQSNVMAFWHGELKLTVTQWSNWLPRTKFSSTTSTNR